MNVRFNNKKSRTTERSVDSIQGYIDVAVATEETGTTGANLKEIKISEYNNGFRFVKNISDDNIIAWVSVIDNPKEDDFVKMLFMPGYNWEWFTHISTTKPVLTGTTWSGLTRPDADSLILEY